MLAPIAAITWILLALTSFPFLRQHRLVSGSSLILIIIMIAWTTTSVGGGVGSHFRCHIGIA
jgi:hypothetical protein